MGGAVRWVGMVLLLGAAACDGGAPATEEAPADTPVAEAPPAEEWRTLAERSSEDTDTSPREIEHSRDSLRIISELLEASSAVSTGVVVTNLLTPLMVPVASVYAEQRLPTLAHTDTTMLAVESTPLLLHIAEHRGLIRWRVTVQERMTE